MGADNTAGSRLYRRPLGLSWLIGLVVIPLLLAAIGYGAFDRTKPPAPATTPSSSFAALSISRNGNNITLSGDFPDDSAKAALMNSLKALPSGVIIVDQIHINPSVRALDFANADPVFRASGAITDFSLSVSGDTVTLSGTASSADEHSAVRQAAVSTWSRLNVVDKLAVKGEVPPGPAGADACANLPAAINAVTGGPITFGSDGVSLTPAGGSILTQVADKLKACPTARATLNGYTDNTGTEGINIPLSTQRARTVADFLVAHGVAGDHLVVKGLGSVNPITSNDTPDGRAKNRRVEIVVG